MSTPELKTYQGNCHCGAVKFHVKLPEVKTVTACNCSICFKKSYLWIFADPGNLTFERGEDALKSYEFREKAFSHKVWPLGRMSLKMITEPQQFCPNCGTGVMAVTNRTNINAGQLIKLPN